MAVIMLKVAFQNKLHIKVRKPNFKLRKALFKRGLERNCKNKDVLEFDVEKNDRIFFEEIEKDCSFNYVLY